MDLLWEEYTRMQNGQQPEYEFDTNAEVGDLSKYMKVFGSQEIGEDTDSLIMQEAKRFCKHYDIDDDILVQYMWLAEDFKLAWHIDDATRCRSSVNTIMTNDPAPVTFREGSFYYKCAALDVMQEHCVNNSTERVLMRISFSTLTHDKLGDKIHAKDISS